MDIGVDNKGSRANCAGRRMLQFLTETDNKSVGFVTTLQTSSTSESVFLYVESL
jgi:hypothetical protein